MRRAAILIALFAIAAAAAADPPAATLSLEPPSPGAGSTAILRLEVTGSRSIRPPQSVPMTNMSIVGGPSSESRFQWINGQTSSSTTLVYQVQAGKPGPASVGPVKWADGGGAPIEAARIDLTVEKAAAGAAASGAVPGTVSDPSLVARLDPPAPRVGEQAVWTLYLVTRGRATGAEIRSLPDFRGFWAEDLDRENNPAPKTWTLEGRPWHAFPILRKALFPNHDGHLTIGEASALVQVRADIFDIFGESPFGASQTVERRSQPLTIAVPALPGDDANIPVGRFSFRASLDRTSVGSGASAVLTATLTGDGRLGDVAPPALEVSGASLSDPEARLTVKRGSDRLQSTKVWQWVLIPEIGGRILIPPLRLSAFDTATGRIASLSTLPLTIVAQGPPAAPKESAAAKPAAEPPARVKASPSTPISASAGGIAAAVAAGAALLVLAGFFLGRRHDVAAAAVRHSGGQFGLERSIEAALATLRDRVDAASRSSVEDLSRRFDAVRFAPQLSSREEALSELARAIQAAAKRLRIRIERLC